jgi:hypothetical protein
MNWRRFPTEDIDWAPAMASKVYSLIMENDYVRVLDASWHAFSRKTWESSGPPFGYRIENF